MNQQHVEVVGRAKVAALVALAEHGTTTDVQELLVRGGPAFGPPGALDAMICAALAALAAEGVVIVKKHRTGDWCWVSDDPGYTYSDPSEWVSYAGPFTDEPFVQRFDWGTSSGSTWLVVHDTEEERIEKSFDSAEEAENYRAMLSARPGQ